MSKKRVTIQSLKLTNFGRFKELEIKSDGHNVTASGFNGAGKTTLANSFLWVLFGRDKDGHRDDNALIPQGADGKAITGMGLEPTVECALDIDGASITLKKVYAEQIPSRGPRKGQYDGSKVQYFVNDLEVKAKEYSTKVAEICSDDIFQKITDPAYLLSLDKSKLRALITPLVGKLNVTVPKELADAIDRPFPEFKALSAQRLKDAEKFRDRAQAALKSHFTGMVDKPTADISALEKAIAAAKSKQAEIQAEIDKLKDSDAEAERRRAIAKVETQITEARAKHRTAQDTENEKVNAKAWAFNNQKAEIQHKRREVADALYAAQSDESHLQQRIDSERTAWKELVARRDAITAEQYHGETVCPTCGRNLPAESVQAAQDAFNTNRSERLEKIAAQIEQNVETGKQLSEKLNESKNKSAVLVSEVAEFDSEKESLLKKIEDERTKIKNIPFEKTDEYKALSEKLNALKSAPVDSSAQEQLERLNADLYTVHAEMEADIVRLSDARLVWKVYENAQTRLAELETAANDTRANYEEAYRINDLCADYDKAQQKALEKAVNALFARVQFRLFEQLDNGGEREACDVLVYNDQGSLSSSPSTGERVSAGVDIINHLQDFYGVSVPIWIDNAEGVTKPIETDAQLFRLCVTQNKELKIEVEDK